MKWSEEAVSFCCAGEQLLGIVSRPDTPLETGIVIVVGGPQYRAGSHRQFVSLARRLARAGFAVLRFDCRGMGDSTGEMRDFEHIGADIRSAIDALIHVAPQVERIALWGLCDGASAALLYLDEQPDVRVAGLCLLNPWVRTDVSLAKTHVKHYYSKRLRDRKFWLKLASGKVAADAVTGLWRNLRVALRPPAGEHSSETAAYAQRMASAWAAFRGPRLLLISELDYTAKEFVDHTSVDPDWRRAFALHAPERVVLVGADHTCSSPEALQAAEDATAAWAQRAFAPAA